MKYAEAPRRATRQSSTLPPKLYALSGEWGMTGSALNYPHTSIRNEQLVKSAFVIVSNTSCLGRIFALVTEAMPSTVLWSSSGSAFRKSEGACEP